ncbi:MAG: hypothetical protein IH993_08690, partial [Proteobacteria bacterium]|nr:hypothetical protein [Pseudomonadota bacterium]
MHLAAPALAAMLALAGGGAAAAASEDEAVARHSRALVMGPDVDFRNALAALQTRGNPDAAAAMILALRFRRYAVRDLSKALEEVTGHSALGWFDWMLWQEAHPEIQPHPSFQEVKLEALRRIDPDFLRFFRDDWAAPKNMKIR